MTVKVEPLWFVHCNQCTLCQNCFTEADAERIAEEHEQPGACMGDAPWIDKKPSPGGGATPDRRAAAGQP